MPSGQDTLLLAGANDLWKCSLAMGCAWRNTTNAITCMSAQVAGYQHALAWNAANPLEIFVGNDSGLWRSMDAIGETGTACAPTDATHFQNLNGGLGSLAEVVSMSPVTGSPYTMMAGLGANGTAGVKSTTGPTADWPQILGGEGGPVAIDPTNNSNWYVNNQAGVSIYLCSQSGDCTPAAFGKRPVVNDADVSGDGYTMTAPAPFLVDPLDAIAIADRDLPGVARAGERKRMERRERDQPVLDGVTGQSYCNGNALIRSMAAMAWRAAAKWFMWGCTGRLMVERTWPGMCFERLLMRPAHGSAWQRSDAESGEQRPDGDECLRARYFEHLHRSARPDRQYGLCDGGGSQQSDASGAGGLSLDGWRSALGNNRVEPAFFAGQQPGGRPAGRKYGLHRDRRRRVFDAADWHLRGVRVQLLVGLWNGAAGRTGGRAERSSDDGVAERAGRCDLWARCVADSIVDRGNAIDNGCSWSRSTHLCGPGVWNEQRRQTVTVTNTGGIALTPTAIAVSGDFSETDNCQNAAINAGASCAVQVTFSPTQTGSATGQMTISANVAGGQLRWL